MIIKKEKGFDNITLCKNCNCMTKTIKCRKKAKRCGKCGELK